MPTKHCAFANCTSDSRYKQDGVKFVPFVKPNVDKEKCLQWIHLSRRTDLTIEKIKKHTYVCTKHFINSNGPTIENPNPLSATISKIPKDRKRKQRCAEKELSSIIKKRPKLTCSATSDESRTELNTNNDVENSEDVQLIINLTSECTNLNDLVVPYSNYEFVVDPSVRTVSESDSCEIVTVCDSECQTEEDNEVKQLRKYIESLEKKLESIVLDVDSCRKNAKAFKYYTGLKPEDFDTLWEFLEPCAAESLKKWLTIEPKTNRQSFRSQTKISPKNQLFLTLIRLHSGLLLADMSFRLNVSIRYLSKIFTTWIQFMYQEFKKLDIFPSADTIKKNNLPKVFRKFKNIRVIIDCFEWNKGKSKNFNHQGNTCLSYKSHNTVKFLIGVIPTGGCCFLSDGFKGRISERQITVKSGLFNYIKKGDLIIADRGFNLEELCNKHQCSLVIPPFLKKHEHLTKEEITAREIAAARIHVERFIGRMKQFRIMQRVISKNMLPIISQITFVIAMLVNFQGPLVI